MKYLVFFIIGVVIVGFCKIVSLNEQIKKQAIKESLDIQESRQREALLYYKYKELNEALSPEFKESLKQFTAEVKTENQYLESFKKDMKQ